MPNELERERFEKWVTEQTGYPFPLPVCRMENALGDVAEYQYQDARFAWQVWQAAFEAGRGQDRALLKRCLVNFEAWPASAPGIPHPMVAVLKLALPAPPDSGDTK